MNRYTSKIYTKDELLSAIGEFGRKFNIPAIYLFGSYARGEATSESDVDIAIDARIFMACFSSKMRG